VPEILADILRAATALRPWSPARQLDVVNAAH
jgi:hypothetical protein